MRVKIILSKNTEPVPINHHMELNRFINKSLGYNNPYHDINVPCCISTLQGGTLTDDKKYINFKNECFLLISVPDFNTAFLSKLCIGITKNPIFGFGIKFITTEFISEEFVDGQNNFFILSPFIIRIGNEDGTYRQLKYGEKNFERDVENYLFNKVKRVINNNNLNYNISYFKVKIKNINTNKSKLVIIHNTTNIANQCPLNIFCSKEVAALLYNIGIGKSTKSGFGTVCLSENRHLFRN